MKKLYLSIEKRLAQVSTLISLIPIALLSPELLEYIIKTYQYEEILKWWNK